MINVAILGFGTIGSGVNEIIEMNNEILVQRIGQPIQVKYILDLRDFPGSPVEKKVVHDINIILDDPEVNIVVETMGGTGAAYEFSKAALLKGKNVCTSNKAVVAAFGTELLAIAKENNINFMFEASVGGGIPIIRPLVTAFAADKILEITGILNGTTNYMLTKMAFEGQEYADVLKQAQALGYAEQDPTADVAGHDSCRKIAILTSIMTGKEVNFEDVHTEGITEITATDFAYAKAMNKSIKLFTQSKLDGDQVVIMVAPTMVGPENQLFVVNDVYNGILVKGNAVGDIMLYGSGAGKLPTASAVVADIVDIGKNLNKTLMSFWNEERLKVGDYKQLTHRYFVRVGGDAAAKADDIKSAFGQVEIVKAVEGEFAFITAEMKEAAFDEKIESINGIIKFIRVEQ